MNRLLLTLALVFTMSYSAGREGISYSPREWWRIWQLAWETACEEGAG